MKKFRLISAVTLLGSSLLCSAAFAGAPAKQPISAVQGIQVQPLSVSELQSTSGQLNAYDIAAALTAEAAKLAKYPKAQAGALKMANWYTTNATAINAEFKKLGLLTACKSCK